MLLNLLNSNSLILRKTLPVATSLERLFMQIGTGRLPLEAQIPLETQTGKNAGMLWKQFRGKTKCLVEIGKRPFVEKSLQSTDCMRATSTALRKLLVIGEVSYQISQCSRWHQNRKFSCCKLNLFLCFFLSLFSRKFCFWFWGDGCEATLGCGKGAFLQILWSLIRGCSQCRFSAGDISLIWIKRRCTITLLSN